MRWLTPQQAITAVQVSSRFPFNHGAPIHIGDPAEIGADLENPLFGGPVPPMPPGTCRCSGHAASPRRQRRRTHRLPIFIAHAPAHSFITDLPARSFDDCVIR